ncbi:CDP-glycerol--glycerophosphate glycerophosphotransferase [Pradoshia sp. D12]|nr:CDP-glycerol--glycerophosphate glycerophosphotransferase [Pradoshia sp. D12]TPF71886.1 CDP-glycerol--glycerophosphate glycerophosphotransferase [Bacillus sp. D12]
MIYLEKSNLLLRITSKFKENKGRIFNRFFSTYVFRFCYRVFTILPINGKKILFASDSRTKMEGNFRFVFDELQRQNKDFTYRYMLKEGTAAKKTCKEILELSYHLATSKYILLDDFYPMVYPLKIREGAELIQLWHAVGAFKKFGFSRVGLPGGPEPDSLNHKNYTKAIVSSKNVAKHYAEGFGIEESKVIATGIPRTDLFFNQDYKTNKSNQLYEQYPFLKDKKVILFAPTFRGPGQQSAYYPLEYLNLDKIYQAFHEKYLFLFKIHPFVKVKWKIPPEYRSFFYDFSFYSEINDLLLITDLLITDYSSVCFEFALLDKPMIFYAPDMEEYTSERDFYYDYESFIPGPMVTTEEELIKTIKNGHFEVNKLNEFRKYFFDELDGKSSERVVRLLK